MLVAIYYSQGSLLMPVNVYMYMTRISYHKMMIECYSVLNYPNSISDHMLIVCIIIIAAKALLMPVNMEGDKERV